MGSHKKNSDQIIQQFHSVRTYINFETAEAAEEWRYSGKAASVFTMLIFRITGTWKYKEPPSALEKYIAKGFAKALRQLGKTPTKEMRAKPTIHEGIRIKPLGWILIASEETPHILKNGVVSKGKTDQTRFNRIVDFLEIIIKNSRQNTEASVFSSQDGGVYDTALTEEDQNGEI